MTACEQHPQDTPKATHTESPQPTTHSIQKNIENRLFLRFLATGETFYQEFKLEGQTFSYTYFDDKEKRCEQWVQSRPCWMEDDLTTVSKTLSEKEIKGLYETMRHSGVLDIAESKLGGAKKGQRFYAQRLEIRMGSSEKVIIYQNFPGASPKPKAFQLMENAMIKFAQTL